MREDELMHYDKGQEAKSHKYSAREWINGAWRYFYGKTAPARAAVGRAKSSARQLGRAIDAQTDRLGRKIRTSRPATAVRRAYAGALERRYGDDSLVRNKQRVRNEIGNFRESLSSTRGKAIATIGKTKRRAKKAITGAATRTAVRARNTVTNLRGNVPGLIYRGKNAVKKRAVNAWNSIVSGIRDWRNDRLRKKGQKNSTTTTTSRRDKNGVSGPSYTGTRKTGIYASRRPR